MYTKEIINNLVNLINKNIGAGNKDVIAEIVRKEFSLLFCMLRSKHSSTNM